MVMPVAQNQKQIGNIEFTLCRVASMTIFDSFDFCVRSYPLCFRWSPPAGDPAFPASWPIWHVQVLQYD